MTEPGLVMDGATVRLDGRVLLGPIDLRLGPGLQVVMGANGAGKSLFLRLAAGLIRPAAGRVAWSGRPAHQTVTERGFVFQSPPLMRRSVAANVGFPLAARGVPRAEIRTRVAEVLQRVRLSDRARVPAAALSGGERQRMAFARALVTGPRVLMMDEPSASLDPASTAELEALIRAAGAEGVQIVMSTHDVAQARRLAGGVLFFSNGRLVETGAGPQFFEAPRSEAASAYLEGRL